MSVIDNGRKRKYSGSVHKYKQFLPPESGIIDRAVIHD